jgi:hypothetical protein
MYWPKQGEFIRYIKAGEERRLSEKLRMRDEMRMR